MIVNAATLLSTLITSRGNRRTCREVYSAYFGDTPIPTGESTRDGIRNEENRRVVNIEGLQRSGLRFSMNPIGDGTDQMEPMEMQDNFIYNLSG